MMCILLQEPKKEPGHYKKTIEKEHGWTVAREYYQTDETGWYGDKKKWKGFATFGIVQVKYCTARALKG